MIESTIQHKLVQKLRANGFMVVKCNLVSVPGWPDLQVLDNEGHITFIECKRLGQKPRPVQYHVHNKLRERCFDVLVYDGTQPIDEILNVCAKR